MDLGYRLPPSRLGSARASTALTLGSASVLDSGGGNRTHHRGETLWAEVAIVAAFAFLFRPNSRTKIGQMGE